MKFKARTESSPRNMYLKKRSVEVELLNWIELNCCKLARTVFEIKIKLAWMVEESFTPGPVRVRDLQSPEIFRLFRQIKLN